MALEINPEWWWADAEHPPGSQSLEKFEPQTVVANVHIVGGDTSSLWMRRSSNSAHGRESQLVAVGQIQRTTISTVASCTWGFDDKGPATAVVWKSSKNGLPTSKKVCSIVGTDLNQLADDCHWTGRLANQTRFLPDAESQSSMVKKASRNTY